MLIQPPRFIALQILLNVNQLHKKKKNFGDLFVPPKSQKAQTQNEGFYFGSI
jgi:hypothetical protein